MMVLLTVVADWMIAVGGYLTSRLVLEPAVVRRLLGADARPAPRTATSSPGLIMAAVFGLLISLIACYEGLKVTRRGRGRRPGHHHDRGVLHRRHHRRRVRVHGGLLRVRALRRRDLTSDDNQRSTSTARTAQPVIRVVDLVKRFDGRAVLDGVNLEVYPGETMVIMGGSRLRQEHAAAAHDRLDLARRGPRGAVRAGPARAGRRRAGRAAASGSASCSSPGRCSTR